MFLESSTVCSTLSFIKIYGLHKYFLHRTLEFTEQCFDILSGVSSAVSYRALWFKNCLAYRAKFNNVFTEV